MSANAKRLIIWLTLGSLLVLALILLLWPRAVAVDLAVVAPGSLIVTIDEEGETRVRDTFILSAPVAGHISRIEAEVGDRVTAGETFIAEIEPVDPALLDVRSLAQAQAAVRSAEAAEAVAAANLARAQADGEFLEAELNRTRQLRNENMVSARELDAALRNARTARAAVDTVKASLEVTRHELERVQAQLLTPEDSKDLKAGCACVPVIADIDAEVLQVLRQSEGIVTAGEPLLELGDTSKLEIVVDLLSTDAVQVRTGQRVIVENWGGGETLDGTVRRVEPYAHTKVSALGIEEQRVNVMIDMNSPHEKRTGLGHGYQLDTSIVLWEGDEVLTVPLTALFRVGNAWAVYVEQAGRAALRQVVVGRKNGLHTQITEGLDPGERIVLYPSDKLEEGVRIAQRKSS